MEPLRLLSAEDVNALATAQQDALLDLFTAITLADGQVTEPEIAWIGQRVVHGAFVNVPGAATRLNAALARFPRDPAAYDAYVRDAATRLAAPALGERVLGALIQLSESDRAQDAERRMVAAVANVLGISTERINAIAAASAGEAIFPLVARGDVAAVRALLDAGTPVDTRDRNQWTPLHVAVACGQREVVALLLERRAPVDVLHGQGSSPIFCACNKPYADLIRTLAAAGADPNLRGSHGFVPLHMAALAGQLDVVAALLEVGAQPDSADTTKGNTALHNAAAQGHDAIVALLLARGAASGVTSTAGATPLHQAASEDRVGCAKILLDAGVDPNATDSAGFTAVHLAANNQPGALALLLARGGLANVRDPRGVTPLHVAAREGFTTCARLLLDAGAEIDPKNVQGGTPLFAASIHRRRDVVELLVARGADLDAPTQDGGTPRSKAGAMKQGKLDAITWSGPPVAAAIDDAPTALTKNADKQIGGSVLMRALVQHRSWRLLCRGSGPPVAPASQLVAPDGKRLVLLFSSPELVEAFRAASPWLPADTRDVEVDGATTFAELHDAIDVVGIDLRTDDPACSLHYGRDHLGTLSRIGRSVVVARALAATPLERDAARVVAQSGLYQYLKWNWIGKQGPVALRDSTDRVWIAMFTADDALDAFRRNTETRSDPSDEIAWGMGGVVIVRGGAFDISTLDCDGVVLDPDGPVPRTMSLEDCAKVVQVGRT